MEEMLVQIFGQVNEGLQKLVEKSPQVYEVLVSEYTFYRMMKPVVSVSIIGTVILFVMSLFLIFALVEEDMSVETYKKFWVGTIIMLIIALGTNAILVYNTPNIGLLKDLMGG